MRWSRRGGWPSTPNWSRGPLRSARLWWKAPSVRSWIASRHARPCSTWGRPPISYGGGGTSKDDRGDKCGHAFSQTHRWWMQVVLYLTESGGHCADMEEHMIAMFKKAQYDRGCCQNISFKSLRVDWSAVGPHCHCRSSSGGSISLDNISLMFASLCSFSSTH